MTTDRVDALLPGVRLDDGTIVLRSGVLLRPRDLRVLAGLAAERTYIEIGDELGLSRSSIKQAVAALTARLDLQRSGLITLHALMRDRVVETERLGELL